MPNKIFSIYSPQTEQGISTNKMLIVKVAKSHVACISKVENETSIDAFELFRLEENDKDFEECIRSIKAGSTLLSEAYSSCKIFIQNEMSVLVPLAFFKEENAGDYLDVSVGENKSAVTMNDMITGGGGMVNAYLVYNDMLSVLHANFGSVTIEHVYTQIVRDLLKSSETKQVLKVQFYFDHVIVAVSSYGGLQLIQTFNYTAPADVLYHLLNITQRFKMDTEKVLLEISGSVDINSEMFSLLFKYFKNVSVEKMNDALLNHNTGEFPPHYFIPFIKLAV